MALAEIETTAKQMSTLLEGRRHCQGKWRDVDEPASTPVTLDGMHDPTASSAQLTPLCKAKFRTYNPNKSLHPPLHRR